MLYAWMGFLNAEADPIPPELQRLATDLLEPACDQDPAVRPAPRRVPAIARGCCMIFEHESFEAARSFVAGPVLKAGLYEAPALRICE